jgi:anaerobic magnesium-protoporphyrin IX monomethyl ester cyclase
MTADVLFGQAYYLRFDPKLWGAQQPYAPLGTLYAVAVVRERGYRVALFDAMLAHSEAEWAAALDASRPRVAVLYEDNFNYLSKMCLLRMRQAALAMVAAARARGAVAVVSGSDASDHPAVYLDAGADVVIAGEGESTLTEVLDALFGRDPARLLGVDGICIRDGGRVVRTRPRGIIRDLDSLPWPAWDLVDVERYRAQWRRRHGYFSMNIATTRGCPYHCNWCAKPIYGQRYTARSPESVVDEIRWLKRTYHPDHLWIADDIFGLKPGWIERFAALARTVDAVVPFKCLLRADGVTDPVARALREAGCQTAWIGAESGSQRVLDAMEKGTRIDQIASATERLRREGIAVGFFLQFGYPGETMTDIDATRQMVRACRPDDIGISVSYPLPGTPFFERVKAQLGAKQNWRDSDDLAMMYRATYPPDFYRALHAVVHAEFRVQRAWARVRQRPLSQRAAREAAAATVHACRLPILRRRLEAARSTEPAGRALVLHPVLNRQAAATPTDPCEAERVARERDLEPETVEEAR